jgi:hypothetical protein
MAVGRRSRITVAALGAALLAALAAVGAYTFAARSIESRILAALGPRAEVGRVSLRPGAVVIEDLVVRAPAGWPTGRTLAARRVVVVPELRTLLSSRLRIARVAIDDAYLSVLRSGDGRVRMLPGGAEAAGAREPGGRAGAPGPATPAGRPPSPGAADPGAPAAGPTVGPTAGERPSPRAAGDATGPGDDPTAGDTTAIARVELRGGTLEFFDAAVRKPPLRLRASALEIDATDLSLPSLARRVGLRVGGSVEGAPGRPEGRLSLEGWVVPATRDSALRATLRGVDLVVLQPYLLRAAEAGVRAGTLELDLASTVKAQQLRAPGTLAITGLDLASGRTFMGLPREAVLAMLRDSQGAIRLDFVLQGRLDDPRFSLSEDLAVRLAAAIAQSLGIGLGGLARDVGGAGQKAIDAATGALRGLFGR